MLVSLTFALLLVLLFANAPVFIAILGSSIFYFVFNDSLSWMMVVQRCVSGLESIPLLAVPFFVMAGVFMNYTGITPHDRFARSSRDTCRRTRADEVVLCTLMGGLSGSSLADGRGSKISSGNVRAGTARLFVRGDRSLGVITRSFAGHRAHHYVSSEGHDRSPFLAGVVPE